MRTPIIAGNWKMHKNIRESELLASALLSTLPKIPGVEKVICPPFVSLPTMKELLWDSNIGLGAQNAFWEDEGAYTGEVSAFMLKGLVSYVILGHSERRKYFGETDETVNKRVHAVVHHGMTPIVCVGEVLEERDAGQTDQVVSRQVRAALAGLEGETIRNLIIAYEPVWAIGTGRAATAEEANRVIGQVVRGTIVDLYGDDVAQAVRIQYGGSVKPKNTVELMSQPDIDGALVGGASLQADDFLDIIRQTAEVYGFLEF